jgi:hypothetical protein
MEKHENIDKIPTCITDNKLTLTKNIRTNEIAVKYI